MADVLRGSPSLDALGGEDLSIVVLEVGMNLLGIGWEGPRRKGIDGNAVRSYLPCQRSREADDASLGSDIVEQERNPTEKGDRGDVDDPAATGRLERGIGGAGAKVVNPSGWYRAPGPSQLP